MYPSWCWITVPDVFIVTNKAGSTVRVEEDLERRQALSLIDNQIVSPQGPGLFCDSLVRYFCDQQEIVVEYLFTERCTFYLSIYGREFIHFTLRELGNGGEEKWYVLWF